MYNKHFNTKKTSQGEPIPGQEERMVSNRAGGVVFPVDNWKRLDRFLILGAESGTYYASEHEMTRDNANSVLECIKEDGPRVVARVVEISEAGRAPKNDPALFVLAMCAGLGDKATKSMALESLPRVARIGTHLFRFVSYIEGFRGWGRGLRGAVASWYTDKDLNDLQYQLIKYQSRYEWSNRDLLRLSHVQPYNKSSQEYVDYNTVFKWVTHPDDVDNLAIIHSGGEKFNYIRGIELIKLAQSDKDAASLINAFHLPREAIPTQFLTSPLVWEALLEDMPMMALLRNLGNLSHVGLLKQGEWDIIEKITTQFGDLARIKKSRLHPLSILLALSTYSAGRGVRGSNTWEVVPTIVDALDKAFYMAFNNVEPTNQRLYLALDVSGSMGGMLDGTHLSAAQAAAALVMSSIKVEPQVIVKGFTAKDREKVTLFNYRSSGNATMRPIPLTKGMSLNEALVHTTKVNFGGTDCALPMLDAIENKLLVDTFVIYTDSETWAGDVHPMQALQEYRRKSGINAKLVVVAMTSTGYSIADPRDGGSLDVVGFDTAIPTIIHDFVVGRV